MNKLECDVIRDLLPSYVDGICSEATKRCVDEHLCGNFYGQLLPAFLTDTGIALGIGLIGIVVSLILSKARMKKE